MPEAVSIAIETSCRRGGVAVGCGADLLEAVEFAADRRHAVQLIGRLDEVLRRHGRRPGHVREVYVSVGPGSYTGLRVGITVARTLAQAVAGIRCVAVPTVEAVAENAANLDFRHLGVVMDAKEATVYAAVFVRRDGRIVPAGEPRLLPARQFADQAPRPITLIGEGLWYQDLSGQGITLGEESLYLPSAGAVWRVGRRRAAEGKFQDYHTLQPMYLRKPEAVRLWEKRASNPGQI